jgi:hypothetical protein
VLGEHRGAAGLRDLERLGQRVAGLLRLTPEDRRELARTRKAKVTVRIAFTPNGGKAQITTVSATLKRG